MGNRKGSRKIEVPVRVKFHPLDDQKTNQRLQEVFQLLLSIKNKVLIEKKGAK